MLLYRSTVVEATNKEIEPLLKQMVRTALEKQIGPDWYEQRGKQVMQRYRYYKKFCKKMEDGLSSIEAMDLTSLLFLLFPYEDKPGNAAPKGEDQQLAASCRRV